MPMLTTTRSTHRGCLTLNASYEPLVLLPVQRAVRLVLDGRAELVEAHGTRVIRSAGREMPMPAVIRLVRFVYVPRRMRRGVTNTILFARDGYACAYCGRHRDALRGREFLTRDHVIPQSRFARRGDANTWDNCVTACGSCNNRKADRTPAEAGMTLRTAPVEPHFVHLEWAVRRLTPLQRKYVAQFFGQDVADAL
jgi:5-methylcytosine-specific restriction endonuclease McrA